MSRTINIIHMENGFVNTFFFFCQNYLTGILPYILNFIHNTIFIRNATAFSGGGTLVISEIKYAQNGKYQKDYIYNSYFIFVHNALSFSSLHIISREKYEYIKHCSYHFSCKQNKQSREYLSHYHAFGVFKSDCSTRLLHYWGRPYFQALRLNS